jgi:hypothetical protein
MSIVVSAVVQMSIDQLYIAGIVSGAGHMNRSPLAAAIPVVASPVFAVPPVNVHVAAPLAIISILSDHTK